ncbi:MAG: Rossmann fold nucleotide-binding protein Smf possibly involved in DNA uptake [uncultured Acidimicrobiales bacterium]|uniref:Rossmann fold nucleotide-binding protein Smf possibly involved in DNA uptake n=1 Tax=uncultured Acidimicrobiales bacterium TaxID=310071 RepID=A0A6J4IKA3_9ACTN|nr:MAG: Rossmann fold nucleotide-binding protein Smf possibly involved in DNA uptake [uncultured Acidimicrobiales bacterium]
MGPRQLGALLEAHADPEGAWASVVAGRAAADPAVASVLGRNPSARAARWAVQARTVEPHELLARHRAAGVTLLTPWHPAWPARLVDDPEPPAMLCTRGDPAALAGPACAMVGTRSCSGEGRRIAHDIGRDLADAGVAVVSGLALGIDGAAHRGALTAGPGAGGTVGVVAGGVDVTYPPSHAALFDDVAAAGALVSEAPLGTPPERWRFPARNRIIAALADVVVVVESHDRGGSMHTVDAAIERGRTVGAVPGPVRSPASAGTNALLADQALVVRDAQDVLVALGLGHAALIRSAAGAPRSGPAPEGADAAVLEAVGFAPTTTDDVVAAAGVGLAALTSLHRLTAAGLVDPGPGTWSRRGDPGR